MTGFSDGWFPLDSDPSTAAGYDVNEQGHKVALPAQYLAVPRLNSKLVKH